MADTLKRLSGPVFVATSASTHYTVPASTTATVRAIHVANETGSSANFTLSVGTDGAGKRLFKDVPIAANDVLDWTGTLVLSAAEVIQAVAGTGSALTLTMSGVETT